MICLNNYTNRNRDGDCKELYSLDTASGIWNNVKQFNNVTNEVNPFQKKGELPDVMLECCCE